MTKKQYFLILLIISPITKPIVKFHDVYDIPVELSGYVKHESFWDSRQVVGEGFDQVLLYPEPKKLDNLCDDINGRGQFDSVPIQTRLHIDIDGPQIRNATSSAVIEGHFFGRAEIHNIFSLRHAYFKLDWGNVEFIGGQTWHPMYFPECEVRTVSFNTGLPIAAFARDPQVSLIYKTNHFDIQFTAISELGFVSDGPIGFSSTYMRNGVVPNLDFRVIGHSGEHIFAALLDYKRIRPRLETNTGLKTDETLNSVSAALFNTLNYDSISICSSLTFAQNGTDQSLIGGYAVKCIDAETDIRSYTNINTLSVWTDWQCRPHKPVQFGLFFGYIKSFGARTCIEPNLTDADDVITERRIFGFGTDIDHIIRLSPRVQWKVKDFEFAGEVEFTRSAFGIINDKAKVVNTCPVNNTRLLLALFYFI